MSSPLPTSRMSLGGIGGSSSLSRLDPSIDFHSSALGNSIGLTSSGASRLSLSNLDQLSNTGTRVYTNNANAVPNDLLFNVDSVERRSDRDYSSRSAFADRFVSPYGSAVTGGSSTLGGGGKAPGFLDASTKVEPRSGSPIGKL